MRNATVLLTCLLLGATSAVAPAWAGPIVIDNFQAVGAPDPWPLTVTSATTLNATENGLSGVLGGTRHATLVGETFAIPGLDFARLQVLPQPIGRIDYLTSSAGNARFTLEYDGGGAPGGLNANFADQLGIQLTISAFDRAGSVNLPVTVEISDGSEVATGSTSLTTAGGQTKILLFNDFTNIGSVDLSEVQAVTVHFQPAISQDLQLQSISTYFVPEPNNLALVGMLSLAAPFLVGRFRRAVLSVPRAK